MQALRSWLTLRQALLGLIPAALIIVIAAGITHKAPPQRAEAATPAITAPVPQRSAIQPSPTTKTAVPAADITRAKTVARSVILIANSKKAGDSSTSVGASLRGLVTPSLEEQIRSNFNGPALSATVSVTEVIFESDATAKTPQGVRLEARVTKKIVTPSTTQVVFPTMTVELRLDGKRWVVTDISEF